MKSFLKRVAFCELCGSELSLMILLSKLFIENRLTNLEPIAVKSERTIKVWEWLYKLGSIQP